ncbi:hypothetical protein B0H14DRAFT_2640140 [Mycena olivaceomarginata]|nr:hypothetical protein B0H14DRAFT_2640140 [Mycena olivaceomarginata]
MPPEVPESLQEACRQCPTQTPRSQCLHRPAGGENHRQLHPPSNASSLPQFYQWLMPRPVPNPESSWNFSALNSSTTPPIHPMMYPLEMAGQPNPAMTSFADHEPALPRSPTAPRYHSTASDRDTHVPSTAAAASTAAAPNPDDEQDHETESDAAPRSVNGARRGNQIFKVVRGKPLRPALEEQSGTSARFLRCVSDILDRCERVSEETGCWLHFSAQHMFGQGGYLHYTSPRFLKEAKKDAEQIINHFNQTFATLMAARHQETKNMHKRLLLAEEDKETATAALAVAQEAERDAIRQSEEAERMRDLHAEEIAAQRLELEALKARLALAQKRNGA